jgi:hypothetical protein
MAAIDRLLNAAENVVDVVPNCLDAATIKREAATKMLDELRLAFYEMNRERNTKAIEENKAAAETEMRFVPTVPSLRDHFAGLAMQGIISLDNHRVWQNTNGETLDQWRDRLRLEDATLAYAMADAMLKARQQ